MSKLRVFAQNFTFTVYFSHFTGIIWRETRTYYSSTCEAHIGHFFAKKNNCGQKNFFEKKYPIDAELKGEQLIYNALLSKLNS